MGPKLESQLSHCCVTSHVQVPSSFQVGIVSQMSSRPSIAPLMKRGLLGLLAMTKERDTVFLCSLTLPLELGEKFRKASGSDWRPSSNMRQLLGRGVSLRGGWGMGFGTEELREGQDR